MGRNEKENEESWKYGEREVRNIIERKRERREGNPVKMREEAKGNEKKRKRRRRQKESMLQEGQE